MFSSGKPNGELMHHPVNLGFIITDIDTSLIDH